MRSICLRLILVLLFGALLIPLTPAAAQSGCLPAGGCVTISYTGDTTPLPYEYDNHYGPIAFDWRITVTGGPISSAVLETDQSPGMPFTDPAVLVNGNPLPPGAVTIHDIQATIDLASVLPVADGSVIDVEYYASVVPYSARFTSSVSLTIDDAAAAGSGPVTVLGPQVTRTIAAPDLRLATSSVHQLAVPRRSTASFGVTVSDRSPAQTLYVELVLDFPPGFRLGPHGAGTGIDAPICRQATPRQWVCDKGHTSSLSTRLEVAAEPGAPIGTRGELQVTARSTGPDLNPTDNAASITLTVAGLADLQLRLEPPGRSTVVAGGSRTVTVVVHNAGPDPATGLLLTFRVLQPFAAVPGIAVIGPDGLLWHTGQQGQAVKLAVLPPGRTSRVSFRLGGRMIGTSASLTVTVTSSSVDRVPAGSAASGSVAVVAAAASTGQSSAVSGQLANGQPPVSTTTQALAATGAQLAWELPAGLVLLGALLCWAGRRRGLGGARSQQYPADRRADE